MTLLLKVTPFTVNVPIRSVPTLSQLTFALVHGPFKPVRKVLQSPSPKTPPTVKTEAEKFVPVRFTGPLASDAIPLVKVAEPLTTIGSAWALEMAASMKVTTASTRTNLTKESCRDVYMTNNPLTGMTLE